MGKLAPRVFILLICALTQSIFAGAATCAKLDPSLVPLTQSPDAVHVFIFLHDQPLSTISQEVQSAHVPRIRELEEELRAISMRHRAPRAFLGRDDEAAASRQEMSALTPADRKEMRDAARRLSAALDEMKKEIGARAHLAVDADQRELARQIGSMGGRVVYGYGIVNALAVFVPGIALPVIADLPGVARIAPVDIGEGGLNVSVPSIIASTFYNAGETGGAFRPAICDTGVDSSHPALGSHSWTSGVFHAAGSTHAEYGDSPTSTDDLNGHGTHVAGIVLSTDATYRGVAYGSTSAMNLKAGWRKTNGANAMYWSDAMQAVDWGINLSGFPPVAINFSFGSSSPMADSDMARFWDAVVDGELTSAAICAGNTGPNNGTLWDPSEAYNCICVANMNDMGSVSRADDVIAQSSSRGPVGNGRKKPDISAPGSSILSTWYNWEGISSDFLNMTGTSMATPHVVGTLTLLADAGVTDPRAAKALIINTAEDKGATGWDNAYGWGYIDLDHLYFHRADVIQSRIYPTGTAGDHYQLYRVAGMSSGEKCTLVWNRGSLYNGGSYPSTSYALSDLNLSLYREDDDTLIAASASTVDNVEQVVAGGTGAFIVKVDTPSMAFGRPNGEPFALATEEGAARISGPILTLQPEAATYTPGIDSTFEVRARVANTGGLSARSCSVTLGTLPQGLTLVSGAVTQDAGSAPAGGWSQWVVWTLQAMPVGLKTIDLSCIGNACGVSFGGLGQFRIQLPDVNGTVKINNNASSTSNRNVTLQLTAGTAVTEMRLRNEVGDWSGWETFAATRAWRLTAGDADKTVYAQFRDAGHNTSIVVSDSISYTGDATVGSIGEAKILQDGTYVTLVGKVITARLDQLGWSYVEELNRSAGIRVSLSDSEMVPSKFVDVSGILSTANGERLLVFASAMHITPGSAVRPLMVNAAGAGGKDFAYLAGPPISGQRGVVGGSGLNNIGLLIRISGRIFSDGRGGLCIDDGSRPSGVKLDTSCITNIPPIGSYRTVTGVCSVRQSSGLLYPVIIPRGNSDVVPL